MVPVPFLFPKINFLYIRVPSVQNIADYNYLASNTKSSESDCLFADVSNHSSDWYPFLERRYNEFVEKNIHLEYEVCK